MENANREVPKISGESFTMDNLWKALRAMQGEVFYTAKGLEFHFSVRGYEIFVDRKIKSKSITRSSVELVFQKLLERVRAGESFPLVVTGPKKLGVFGASYLYPILIKMGIICRKEESPRFSMKYTKEHHKMRAEVVAMDCEHPDQNVIKKAGQILKDGGLVAFPTETVYGLGGNALDPKASMKIYAAKGRPSDNPLIVHIADMDSLGKITTNIPKGAMILAEKFWPGPLTMILPKADIVPGETTGGLNSVAVRFPSDVIAQELIRAAGGFVAAPSANTSGRPSPTMAEHVEEDLGDAIDMILDGGQVGIGLESTIVDFTEEIPVVLRPGYISLEMLKEILGEVRMDRGLLITDSSVRPKAPGMKYRHYAPRADLSIVEGTTEQVVDYINQKSACAAQQGEQIGIIATDETAPKYKNGVIRSIGSREDEESIAHHLYEVLREFDGDEVTAIYSEAFYTPRMGQAIMNRLLKAAGHKIIHLQEEQK